MIQYIASGYTDARERVILWRVGEYQYKLEVANNVEMRINEEYTDAIKIFDKMVVVFD